MEYKDTLLMPKTEFNMRGNLPVNEGVLRKHWEDINLYEKIVKKNKNGVPFVLHDGPPYANGNIHLGHALNKLLKDFINRSKMMEGYNTEFIPGWDVHGLPIETAITKTGVDRKTMSKGEFRKLCAEYANGQIEKQKEQFKTLNVIADWDNPYVTMSKEFEARQIEVFAEMTKKGLVFKGLKPVYWSPTSETALAEAEIEYKDKRDPSLYVGFPVVDGNDKVDQDDNLVIWTTTPWTLPGNLAIAVGEEIEYVKVNVNNKNYILAEDLLEELINLLEWEDYKLVDKFTGNYIEGIHYNNLLMNRISPVVIGHHVTTSSGTGLVHIAPSYGVDDFIIGNNHNLGMVNGVNDQGVLTEESGEFAGHYYEDANRLIGEKLEELGLLLKLKFITHSYPHDWRTKKPIIFRATPQWFCKIDPIREELLNEIDNNIEWLPEWGRVRLHNMISDRGDWCISRQRAWGVPIPIFYNEDGSEILDYDVMIHVSNLFREHGSNVWFERSATDLLPIGYTNPKSPNGNFTKEEDIMDVWFDSGSSHTGVLKERGFKYPADIYLEGSDQYRGWFNSSLITGVAVNNRAPYDRVISHGYILDGKGIKQSKSLGNVVDPLDIINKDGADILRLWVSSVDYREDVRLSEEIFNQVRESYRKIRNTYRFMLGNLFDFDPAVDRVSFDDLASVDKYILIRLNEVVTTIRNSYNKYNYQEIYKTIINFISVDLSNFYLDFTKDILYIEKNNSLKRRSVQTVIYKIVKDLAILIAPILPFTSEEVYGFIPGEKLESVHLENNPDIETYPNSEEVKGIWNTFFEIKNDVYKALEKARNEKLIGKGLEARVYVNATGKHLEFINEHKNNLKQLLIISDFVQTTDELPKYELISVKVEKFVGHKCERCWNQFNENEMIGDICGRCDEIIN